MAADHRPSRRSSGSGNGRMSGDAAEPDSRPINDAPAGLVDLDRAPLGVAEVEIDLAVKLADPDEHLPHRRVVLRLRLDDAERRRYRFAVRRPAGLLEETPLQPAPEAPRLDRPRLAMPVDLDVGVGDLVGGVEKLGRLGQRDQMSAWDGGRPSRLSSFSSAIRPSSSVTRQPAFFSRVRSRLELDAVRPLERRELA